MQLPHDQFCVLPWVSLETSPTGTVRPCCLALDEIKDDTGEKFNLKSARFHQIQTSQHMRHLREQFLAGERPLTCQRCWNEEDAGRTSKRMHTLDRLKHVISDVSWTADAKPLLFLDLKLGNICNLKCRICGPWSSSTAATEQLRDLPNADKKNNYSYIMLRAGAWPKESDIFWQEIDRHLDHIRYIEFTGGEPFMIQEHFDMLRHLVDLGHAHEIEIHYNTNGTIFPSHAEEIWQNFRTVEVAFSIDDTKERFEYQRSNAVWNDVNDNIAQFRCMRDRRSNIKLQVCSTVNLFNVCYLPQLSEWIDMQNFDFVYWNMLHEPIYFSIGSLPDTVKQAVADRLNQASVTAFHRSEFDRMIDFMWAAQSLDRNKIVQQVQALDKLRNQKLFHHHPEIAQLLSYE